MPTAPRIGYVPAGMTSDPLERLISLVRRELGADDVRVLEGPLPAVAAPNVIHVELVDGRKLAVAFASAPPSRDALVRRLDMLVLTFAQSLEEEPSSRGAVRSSPGHSLREELRALAARAQAVDAVVIDANSPVIWGAALVEPAARPELTNLAMLRVSQSQLVESGRPATGDPFAEEDASPEGAEAAPPSRSPTLTARAIAEVRALPQLGEVHKGRHLQHMTRDANFGCVARSFAGIYLLIVVFDQPFDELRAERAIGEGLPRIERLVLALPPLDPKPAPQAGVMSLRRPRR